MGTDLPAGTSIRASCPNCGAPAGRRFCPDCGQRLGEEVLSVRYWLSQIVEAYLTVDGRVPRSVWALLFRPGFLTREWHQGRRVPYSRPFYLCLWSAVLLVAAIFLVHEPEVWWSWGEVRFDVPVRTLPLFLLASVPFMAQVLTLLEWGEDPSYVEHLVFATHLQGFVYLAAIPLTLQTGLGEAGSPAGGALAVGVAAYAVLYVVVAIRRVYGGGWVRTMGRAAVLWLAYMVVAPLGTAVIAFAVIGGVVVVVWALGLALPTI